MASVDTLVAQGMWASTAETLVAFKQGAATDADLAAAGLSVPQVQIVERVVAGTADESKLVRAGLAENAAEELVAVLTAPV